MVENTVITDTVKEFEEEYKKVGEDGLCLPVIGLYSKTAFQSMVERWCGTVDLVYALYDFPEVVDECLYVIQEKDMETVKNALKSSAEGFIFINWLRYFLLVYNLSFKNILTILS